MQKIYSLFLIKLFILSPFAFSGSICAVGGGSEERIDWSDAPYGWMVQQADSGHALVMHYSTGSTWLESYFKDLGAASAASLVIDSRRAADDSVNAARVLAADLIFLRGGNQYTYYTLWKGTRVEEAIRQVFERGGVVGGTSAGLAVLGGVDYHAANSSAVSRDCLGDPFHRDITLSDDFLPLVPGVIFDSHFTARVRQGRLIAFVAHWNESQASDIIGVGVDEQTAFCIDNNGIGQVMGKGAAFIVHRRPESSAVCLAHTPLRLFDWSVSALTDGFRYDLKQRRLDSSAEGAKEVDDPPAAFTGVSATIEMAGSDSPQFCRPSLQRLAERAGNSTIVLITDQASSPFFQHLQAAGATDVVTLALADAPFSEIQLTALQSCGQAMVADCPVENLLSGLHAQETFAPVLNQRLNDSSFFLLLCGPPASALGGMTITNTESHSANLRNGALDIIPGLQAFPHLLIGTNTFRDDAYDENRLGGLFFLLFHQSRGLGVLADEAAAFVCQDNRLLPVSDFPVLLIDMEKVSVIDSSDYRERFYYPPRQSAAFYEARLFAISGADSGFLNLENRSWEQVSAVAEPSESTEMPATCHMLIRPNPGRNTIWFEIAHATDRTAPSLEIYDLLGRRVVYRGIHYGPFKWNGRDDFGRRSPAGCYFAVIRTPRQIIRQPFTLLP
ncbi:Type 1 glutamine amidotransferase-like domain-containing protein [candidate division KSB1 bacterium]|nr:Type 1 glutamine amidotransferase-like domain-containing protein [candidate division KSB1 bacterium]